MKWVAWSLGVVLLGALVVLVVGWRLPAAHVVSRSAVLPQPRETVYAVVADVAGYPTWWSDIARVEVLPSASGRIRFRQHSRTGPLVLEVEEAAPPARFVTRIADPDQPFGGTWTFDLSPEAQGTRLTITERGEIYNPFFRFMARFVFGYSATLESCLAALQRRFAPAGASGQSSRQPG